YGWSRQYIDPRSAPSLKVGRSFLFFSIRLRRPSKALGLVFLSDKAHVAADGLQTSVGHHGLVHRIEPKAQPVEHVARRPHLRLAGLRHWRNVLPIKWNNPYNFGEVADGVS